MQLTTHTDYALRMLIYLHCAGDKPSSVAQIAEAYGVSSHHLAKVAQTLANAGWVVSRRGRAGGLVLSAAAQTVTIGDICRTTEQNLDIVECFGTSSCCPIEPACRLKSVLQKAVEAFFAVLDDHTLADIASQPQTLRSLLQITLPE